MYVIKQAKINLLRIFVWQPKILMTDSLDDQTKMFLVNALYFKGNWKTKFDPKRTRDMPFRVDDKTVLNVPMMSIQTEFYHGHFEEHDATFVEIPYEVINCEESFHQSQVSYAFLICFCFINLRHRVDS